MNHLTVQQLSASMDGAVTGPSLEVVVRHLAVCGYCRERQTRLARHDDVLRRLLAPDTSEAFLESLSRRGEDVAVAVAAGLVPPEMWTTVPLIQDEDPYALDEPPVPARPALGASGAMAQEAGYGLIGMRPTASTQPPAADAAEAQRWMEALESGSPPDPSAFTVLPRTPVEPAAPFELPGWMSDRAAHGPQRPAASPPPTPRDVQPLRLVPEPPAPPPRVPASPQSPYAPPPSHGGPAYPPAPHASPPPALDPYAPRVPGPLPAWPPAPPRAAHPYAADAYAADPYAARMPAERPPHAPAHPHVPSFDDLFDDEPEYVANAADAAAAYTTRPRALAAARRRAREEAQVLGLRRHWLFAGGALVVLLFVVLVLQLLPTTRGKRDQVVSGFPPPRIELVRGDSGAVAKRTAGPQVESASLRAPVEQVVPPRPREAPVDSAEIWPEEIPEDSLDVEPER